MSVIARLCLVCGRMLDVELARAGERTHPACSAHPHRYVRPPKPLP